MAINTKTYITHSTTIVKDRHVNLGLNPILELNYNNNLTRFLIYFPHEKIKSLIDDKTYPDVAKLRHVLKMRNSASDSSLSKMNELVCHSSFGGDTKRFRACSFDLIFFLLPKKWDVGRGFDYNRDLHENGRKAYKECGTNWYQYQNGCNWEEEGIYSIETLSSELEKFTSPTGNTSKIIIAHQHFDFGNESIELDITDTVNKFIDGSLPNNGIGVAFTPRFERVSDKSDLTYYVGFFSNNTRGFYEPYIETTYDSVIKDSRQRVIIGIPNKLYLYSVIGSKLENLDEIPTATINDVPYEVKQETKGVYYIESTFSDGGFEENAMYYDVWSNLKYKGKNIKDVEQSFTTAEDNTFFALNSPNSISQVVRFNPKLSGIQHNEKIRRGDIRRIDLEAKVEYTNTKGNLFDGIQYRLYVMTEQSEQDVIEWSDVEMGFNTHFFYINTNDLIPNNRYYIDVRIDYGVEIIHHHKKLQFDIVNDATRVYN